MPANDFCYSTHGGNMSIYGSEGMDLRFTGEDVATKLEADDEVIRKNPRHVQSPLREEILHMHGMRIKRVPYAGKETPSSSLKPLDFYTWPPEEG